MSWRNNLGFVSVALIVGTAVGANGCSSSNSGSPPGQDSGTIHHQDAATNQDSGGTTATYDGTTGLPCTKDADCLGDAGGPGNVKCSITALPSVFGGDAIYPSGVCMITPAQGGNCSAPNDGNFHFCDGPDQQGSPGICVPLPPPAVTGDCLPLCLFPADGTAAQGCVGKDACIPFGFGTQSSGAAIGIGYCWGGCTQSSDCPTGNVCQTNLTQCVKSATPITAAGSSCLGSAKPTAACNCFATVAPPQNGFCADSCITGDPTGCPAGQVCDANLPTELVGANDATATGFTQQNSGLVGVCLPTCTLGTGDAGTKDSGAKTDAGSGGGCGGFANAVCQSTTAAGADCAP
jgi:hypothetical protein